MVTHNKQKRIVSSQNQALINLVFSAYSGQVISSQNSIFALLWWTERPLWVAVGFGLFACPCSKGLLFQTSGDSELVKPTCWGKRDISHLLLACCWLERGESWNLSSVFGQSMETEGLRYDIILYSADICANLQEHEHKFRQWWERGTDGGSHLRQQ